MGVVGIYFSLLALKGSSAIATVIPRFGMDVRKPGRLEDGVALIIVNFTSRGL